MHVAIIGAGAAGCFAAINLKRLNPSVDITIFESGTKPLAKVAITGGGRCNLTNSFDDIKSISTIYPRGERLMKRLLKEFSHHDAYQWFEQEGVKLVIQEDHCVFPQSQDAMEIVALLTRLMQDLGVVLKTNHRVQHIKRYNSEVAEEEKAERFVLSITNVQQQHHHADVVIVTTGGSQRKSWLNLLDHFMLDIMEPIPSLFSLCLPEHEITELTGIVVNDVVVSLSGTKHRSSGPLLITHWGLSGPAILKLSSYAARTLHENDYKAQLSVNWFGNLSEVEVYEQLVQIGAANPQKKISASRPYHLNTRLWLYLLNQSGIDPEQRWSGTSRKNYYRLVSTLTNNLYPVNGKNRFKEEFVTCGGIALNNIQPRTLECKTCPGLYFAGEVLDVDAITGGFNLQAAWTMGYVVAKSIAQSIEKSTSK